MLYNFSFKLTSYCSYRHSANTTETPKKCGDKWQRIHIHLASEIRKDHNTKSYV